MFARGPDFYFLVASSLAVVVLACVVTIGRLVTPQQPVAQVSPLADPVSASRAMTLSAPKDPSR
jgi:hypothetical protein